MSDLTDYYPVIGLEVHAQLLTSSKMFCGCSADYSGAAPNTHTCPVCSGMPGSLPVINKKALDYGLETALALNCEIASQSKFDRKNYSYPDIPKGYQISQYDDPVGRNGWLEYAVGDRTLRWGIARVHLEEDTGKTIHTSVQGREVSLIDYNRSGVPLMEIVTTPENRTPEEAREFFAALRQVLMYLTVSDGNLQEGSMRADINISLRRPDGPPGTKVEIKNLNSFRAVQRALEYEIERQAEVLGAGGTIEQETRGWVERDEVTVSQRSKEYAHDYRYFPEPDLPPLVIADDYLHELRRSLPELPLARAARFKEQYGLSAFHARVLTDERPLADYFEQAVGAADGMSPTTLANWVTGDFLRLLHDSGRTLRSVRVSARQLAAVVAMVAHGEISGTAGKEVLEEVFETGEDPASIVNRRDLRQLSDEDALERLIDDVLSRNPGLVADYRAGKTQVIGPLIGKTRAASKGKANPERAREILERRLR